MKTFTKITAVLMLLVASPVLAECELSGISGLSEVAQQELRVACQQALLLEKTMESSPLGNVDVSNPEQLSQWGLVAQEWAKALGIAATELGIAVDTFLDTDAGKLTAFVILWQVAGESILGFLLGVPLLITVIVVGLRQVKRLRLDRIEYWEDKVTWRGRPKIKNVIYKDRLTDEQSWAVGIYTFATIVLSIMTISWVIFN